MQRTCAARVAVFYNRTRFFRLFRCGAYHFVRNRSREHNYHIGAADLVSEICGTLREHLTLTAELFADFLIATMHSVMPADN